VTAPRAQLNIEVGIGQHPSQTGHTWTVSVNGTIVVESVLRYNTPEAAEVGFKQAIDLFHNMRQQQTGIITP